MYDLNASELRAQANNLRQKIDGIRSSEPVPVQEAADLRAADLFLVQPVQEKQAFLRLVLKSAQLRTEFETPFGI